ncbi:nickel transport complex protein, NikM subunit, transmembrane [Pedobacter yulinensis]|uniref:Nickel transport complex protein, NikM subunit, transmembrane n=1 Tax=Pedobacter yulinensis TaxID=2126353 RepID=A0A2T3HLM9_9SPHI|nr:nickel transport complex protein, NikM subunit, transmembrane [Pedobacter yulinensis]PST83347.1 nickel transport complex protein, NikM subunit, transmembrane [Pedobacter yulinensis]
MKKPVLFILLLMFGCVQAFAHALWIETKTRGTKGQKQDVKVFFGEYADNERDSTAKWFSNLRSFELALTGPDGKRVILPTTQETGFYSASFTPEKDGLYTLSIVHEVADVYNAGKLQYYALADVQVGTKAGKHSCTAPFDITGLAGAKAGKDAKLALHFDKKPLAAHPITLVAPGAKPVEIKTGTNGEAAWKPVAGAHFLEAVREEKKAGTHQGKPYETIWHMVTLFTEVG